MFGRLHSIFVPVLIAVFFSISFAGENSPYTLSWKVDVPFALLGAGSVSLGNYLYANMEPPSGEPSKSRLLPWDKPFAGTRNHLADNISNYSSLLILFPFVLEISDFSTGNSDLNEMPVFFVMVLETASIESGVNLMLRSTKLWPRPEIFDSRTDRSDGQEWGSFYSGHASAAFAVAVFSSMWFEKKHSSSPFVPWVWAGSLSAASAVAALRVAAGKHYPTDVVVGALAGSLSSLAVLKLHESPESSLTLAPQPGGFIFSVRF
ncbi:MAG: phosphatase PAP2 family protein [Fibrobacteraceae bacterium]